MDQVIRAAVSYAFFRGEDVGVSSFRGLPGRGTTILWMPGRISSVISHLRWRWHQDYAGSRRVEPM